ncbi:hypothetical protein ACAX60_004635 [Serratia marcescens]
MTFTRLTPRVNAREAQASTRLNPPRLVLCLNGMLSAVSVAKIKRVGMSTPLESASKGRLSGKGCVACKQLNIEYQELWVLSYGSKKALT